MRKQALNLIIAVFLTLGLSISLQSLLAAWTPPGANPPTNNLNPPVYNESGAPATTIQLTLPLGTTRNISLGGSNANIVLGDNWLSGDGGDEGIFVDGSGNVGVRTGNPLASLHIANNTAYNNLEQAVGQDSVMLYGGDDAPAGTYHGGITWLSANGTRRRAGIASVKEHADADRLGLAFFTQGTDGPGEMYESMRISWDGNVGIKTNAPTHRLDVRGRIRNTSSDNYDVWIQGGATSTPGDDRNLAIVGMDEDFQDRLYINYGSEYASGTIIGGPVGIGTNVPSQKLSVLGSAIFGPKNSIYNWASGFGLSDFVAVVGDEITDNPGIIFGAADGTYNRRAAIYMDASINSIIFNNSYTTSGRPDWSFITGNVGIGTTTPGAPLTVNGRIRATHLCDENGANCKDISGGWPSPISRICIRCRSAKTGGVDEVCTNIGVWSAYANNPGGIFESCSDVAVYFD